MPSRAAASSVQSRKKSNQPVCVDDPAGRGVDHGARHRRQAREQRELRRRVARIGGARDERDERDRAEADAERLERDDARQAARRSGSPSCASHAKPRIDTTCTTPNSHSPRLMPIFTIHSPPSMPPATLAHRPAFLAIDADVRLGEAQVEVERRGQRGRHAVAELVEEDEREHQQRLRAIRRASMNSRNGSTTASRSVRGAACGSAGSRTTSVIAMPGSMNSAVIDEHRRPRQAVGEDQRQRPRDEARDPVRVDVDRRCRAPAPRRAGSRGGRRRARCPELAEKNATAAAR